MWLNLNIIIISLIMATTILSTMLNHTMAIIMPVHNTLLTMLSRIMLDHTSKSYIISLSLLLKDTTMAIVTQHLFIIPELPAIHTTALTKEVTPLDIKQHTTGDHQHLMEHPIELHTEDMVDTVDTVDTVDMVVQHLSEEDQHHSEVAQYHSEEDIMDLTEVDITVDRTEVGQ